MESNLDKNNEFVNMIRVSSGDMHSFEGCEEFVGLNTLTHRVPNVDVVLASPVIALREGLPVGVHVTLFHVWALSEAIVVQPGGPVVHVTRSNLSAGCPEQTNKNNVESLKMGNIKVSDLNGVCLSLCHCVLSLLKAEQKKNIDLSCLINLCSWWLQFNRWVLSFFGRNMALGKSFTKTKIYFSYL